jgi:hypothetical protein
MSLLSSASEWSSEDQPTAKRQSTIRNKTVKRTTQFARRKIKVQLGQR